MCTVLKNGYCIGRNFDYEISYKEEIINIPKDTYNNENSIIGVCSGIVNDYPLLYDGINDKGLFCGGLAFSTNAKYNKYQEDKMNIPSFDFTFQVLANNKTVKEVKEWLGNVSIWCEQFSDEIPNTDLHWFIADMDGAIIVEQTKDGLNIYEGEVMTNNPPYPNQELRYALRKGDVGRYHHLSFKEEKWFSRGTETDGLDGGYNSYDRFSRVSYLKKKLEESNNKFNPITNCFHLLSSVEQIYGATPVNDKYEYTIYSVVYDIKTRTMWIKTYDKLCPSNYKVLDAELERIRL